MSESVESLEGEVADDAEEKGRQRSTISFPYTDFEAAASVARAIHENVGHGTCSVAHQLAPWMKLSSKSSGFRTYVAAARLFGLIDSDSADAYRLTTLGTQVVDPLQARIAKAEAFLRVPLFKALYEKYKTGVTPPNQALEREIVALGVSEKQKARARQVFESSAQQTGFREHGATRLVMPAVFTKPDSGAPVEPTKNGGGGEGGDVATTVSLNLDPLIVALLQKIPPRSEKWTAEKRLRWFRTFAMNVSQVYDDHDDSAVELDINLASSS